jgi:hypothetical protein
MHAAAQGADRLHDAAGLLPGLPRCGALRALAGLDLAAGERPGRLPVGAPDREHTQRRRDRGHDHPRCSVRHEGSITSAPPCCARSRRCRRGGACKYRTRDGSSPDDPPTTPPMTGPPRMARPVIPANRPMALPPVSGGSAADSSASACGSTMAVPMPWTARVAISTPIDGASAQAADDAVQTARPATSTRRRPSRSPTAAAARRRRRVRACPLGLELVPPQLDRGPVGGEQAYPLDGPTPPGEGGHVAGVLGRRGGGPLMEEEAAEELEFQRCLWVAGGAICRGDDRGQRTGMGCQGWPGRLDHGAGWRRGVARGRGLWEFGVGHRAGMLAQNCDFARPPSFCNSHRFASRCAR